MKKNIEKYYYLVNLKNVYDIEEVTLNDSKEFLESHWMELEENDPYFERIRQANYFEMVELLEGIGYTLFKNKRDLKSFMKEVA